MSIVIFWNSLKVWPGVIVGPGITGELVSFNISNAIDCSESVQYIYQSFKIDLPRSNCEQARVGKIVTRNINFSKLLPEDLLFFGQGRHSIGHAGIYMGEGKMIHASNCRKV